VATFSLLDQVPDRYLPLLAVQVADIIAKQRRIERQDKPTVDGVSFEHSAAGEMMCWVLQQEGDGPMGWGVQMYLLRLFTRRSKGLSRVLLALCWCCHTCYGTQAGGCVTRQ
jgi:hypothetical protein